MNLHDEIKYFLIENHNNFTEKGLYFDPVYIFKDIFSVVSNSDFLATDDCYMFSYNESPYICSAHIMGEKIVIIENRESSLKKGLDNQYYYSEAKGGVFGDDIYNFPIFNKLLIKHKLNNRLPEKEINNKKVKI